MSTFKEIPEYKENYEKEIGGPVEERDYYKAKYEKLFKEYNDLCLASESVTKKSTNPVFLIKRHKMEVDKVIKELFALKDHGDDIMYKLKLMDAIESLYNAANILNDIADKFSQPIE